MEERECVSADWQWLEGWMGAPGRSSRSSAQRPGLVAITTTMCSPSSAASAAWPARQRGHFPDPSRACPIETCACI